MFIEFFCILEALWIIMEIKVWQIQSLAYFYFFEELDDAFEVLFQGFIFTQYHGQSDSMQLRFLKVVELLNLQCL